MTCNKWSEIDKLPVTNTISDDTKFAIAQGKTSKSVLWATILKYIKMSSDNSAKLNNVVYVNDIIADLPQAANGVIELSGGLNVVYVFAAKEFDFGTTTLAVTGGSVVLRGSHRTQSILKSDSPTFINSNGSLYLESLAMTATGGLLQHNGTACVFEGVTVNTCAYVANVTGSVVFSLRTSSILRTTSGGITFTGSHNQLNITNCLFGSFLDGFGLGWAGSLIDLSTGTFDIISIESDNRFFSDNGNIAIAGLIDDGNISTGGRGLVSGSAFVGDGLALSGIDPQDKLWKFTDNLNVEDSRNMAVAYLYTPTVTANAGIGTYTPVIGTFSEGGETSRFTVAANGVITIDSVDTLNIKISANVSCKRDGGSGADLCYFRWVKSTDGGSSYNPVNVLATGSVDVDAKVKSAVWFVDDVACCSDMYRIEYMDSEGTNDLECEQIQIHITSF